MLAFFLFGGPNGEYIRYFCILLYHDNQDTSFDTKFVGIPLIEQKILNTQDWGVALIFYSRIGNTSI